MKLTVDSSANGKKTVLPSYSRNLLSPRTVFIDTSTTATLPHPAFVRAHCRRRSLPAASRLGALTHTRLKEARQGFGITEEQAAAPTLSDLSSPNRRASKPWNAAGEVERTSVTPGGVTHRRKISSDLVLATPLRQRGRLAYDGAGMTPIDTNDRSFFS